MSDNTIMWKKKNKTNEPENSAKAYDYAIFLLSLKLRTEGEIAKKMQERGYIEKIITETLARLKENNYVDDQRYAEVYLDNLKKYKKFGYYGIKKKLMEKRLPSKIIENVLTKGLSEEEELKIAKRLLAKEPGLQKEKIFQRLKTRGFRSSVTSYFLLT